MRKDGSLAAYSWIWSEMNQVWQPLEAPPAPPSMGTEEIYTAAPSTGVEVSADVSNPALRIDDNILAESISVPDSQLEALLYVRNKFVKGEVIELTGKRLLVQIRRTTAPAFHGGTDISMMLFHTETGDSEMTKAKVKALRKTQAYCLYACDLDQVPAHWQAALKASQKTA